MTVTSIAPRTCDSCRKPRWSTGRHVWSPERLLCAECALAEHGVSDESANVVADLAQAVALVEGVVTFNAADLGVENRMTLVLAAGLIDTVLASLDRKAPQC